MPVNHHQPEPRARTRWRRLAAPAAVLALTLGLAACGDSDEDDDSAATPSTQPSPSTTATPEPAGETVEITAVDYDFEGVPETVPPGTELSFTNDSAGEVHEMVLLRINDDETRTIEELAALPEEEATAAFAPGPPALVSFALPGEDGMVAVGSTTLTEPGRYGMVCFVPTGADPQAYRELLAAPPSEGEDGPPDIPGGPPHITMGMFAEFTVQ